MSVIKLRTMRVRVRMEPLFDGALYCRAALVALNGRVVARTNLIRRSEETFAVTAAHAMAAERGWTVVS